MTFFYTIKFSRLKKYVIVVSIFLLALVFIILKGNQNLMVFSTGDQPRALSKGNPDSNNISLTFNITWGDTILEPILDQLKKHGVTATFFLLGEWAEHHPHLVELIDQEGHEIGMLGYRYKSYLELDN